MSAVDRTTIVRFSSSSPTNATPTLHTGRRESGDHMPMTYALSRLDPVLGHPNLQAALAETPRGLPTRAIAVKVGTCFAALGAPGVLPDPVIPTISACFWTTAARQGRARLVLINPTKPPHPSGSMICCILSFVELAMTRNSNISRVVSCLYIKALALPLFHMMYSAA